MQAGTWYPTFEAATLATGLSADDEATGDSPMILWVEDTLSSKYEATICRRQHSKARMAARYAGRVLVVIIKASKCLSS
jgi:hypothetical protein